MADTEFRSIFKNDTTMARLLDGDLDDSDVPKSENPGSGSSGGGGSSYNTGPKGVRRDARAYQQSLQSTTQQSQSTVSATGKIGTTATTWGEDVKTVNARDRWIEARLKELSKSSSRTLERVNADTFLNIVESQRVVITVIDDAGDEDCVDFIKSCAALVNRYAAAKWVTMSYEEAELDSVACPAVLVYVDGNLSVNAMRVTDEIQSGEEVSAKSVEEVLIRIGALKQEYILDSD